MPTPSERPSPTDRPITRRAALAFFGALGLGSIAAACTRHLTGATTTPSAAATTTAGGSSAGASATAAPSCVLTPEVTEGPYYLPLHLVRSDITEEKPGVPLRLDLQVVDAKSCQPISGAGVDIWHADALGVYSGVVPLGQNSTAPSTSGTFLRGVQNTGSDGVATFKTIYPGWYQGRAVHIHVKVLLDDQTLHTGQLFLDDSQTASVYEANAPYNTRPTTSTTDATDNIYRQAGGSQAILAMQTRGSGYLGSIDMGVNA
jgi:protocatechuate 3,4-dioxygenase beta subunit